MASTADINIGSYIRFNNDICQIMEWQHRTPGNLRAFYQGKMRNLRNGRHARKFLSGFIGRKSAGGRTGSPDALVTSSPALPIRERDRDRDGERDKDAARGGGGISIGDFGYGESWSSGSLSLSSRDMQLTRYHPH